MTKLKIIFLGVGLTHYYNQVLNKLNTRDDLEIINVVDSGGPGHAGRGVYQTQDNAHFEVKKLRLEIKNKYSDYSYRYYPDLKDLIVEIGPQIIVTSEPYLKMFYLERDLQTQVKEKEIKIILKEIPFRLDTYTEAKNKIECGLLDDRYCPFFVPPLERWSRQTGNTNIYDWIRRAIASSKVSTSYFKKKGRKILLHRLELYKKLVNFVDGHVNYVEEAFDLLASYGVDREKIFITYNSSDTDILFKIRRDVENRESILPLSNCRLVHLSRLTRWKRVDLIIEALRKLKPDFPEMELLIIGSGPMENELKALSQELGVETAVKFLGGIYDQEELGRYLLASTVYVLAGMGGLSINDAMTFGKPVICSVCDGTEKRLVYNGYNGFYFKEGDDADLADKIKTLLKDHALVTRMGENSTKIIREQINIHTVMAGYLKAFHYVAHK